MNELSVNSFRDHLKSAVDRAILEHQVLHVRRRRGKGFVVMGEDDWSAVAETVHLNQVPGLVESIRAAAREPLRKGTPLGKLAW